MSHGGHLLCVTEEDVVQLAAWIKSSRRSHDPFCCNVFRTVKYWDVL